MKQLGGILETCLYVDDLQVAERFYREVMGLSFVSRQETRHVFFRCGEQMLLIFNPEQSNRKDSELPPHGSAGAGHVAFAVAEQEIPLWQHRLETAGVAIERTVKWPNGALSLYFRDPAGNSLEIAVPRIWGIDGREPDGEIPGSEK